MGIALPETNEKKTGEECAVHEIREQLNLILQSSTFKTSARLAGFLRYVVEETLEGREEQIKEYTLAQDVFQRGIDFDPKESSIVRVDANRLRQKLEQYYLNNPEDGIRIDVPRGTYVPVFSKNRLPDSGESLEAQVDAASVVDDPTAALDLSKEYFAGLSKKRAERYNTRIGAVLALQLVAAPTRKGGYDTLIDIDQSEFLAKFASEPISKNHGVVRGFYEGSLLALFDSAEHALSAAEALQQEFGARNTSVPLDEVVHARVGLDVADVHDWGGIPWGPAVEEATAMADQAGQGGIWVTGSIYDLVNRRPSLSYEYVEAQVSKSRARRYRAYNVLRGKEARATGQQSGTFSAKWAVEKKSAKPKLGVIAAIAAMCVMMAYGAYHVLVEMPRLDPRQNAAETPIAADVSDKVRIAVFPFQDTRSDVDSHAIAELLTVATIRSLTHHDELSVASHGATQKYRGTKMDMRQFGAELDVQFVLAGLITPHGKGLGITLELIEAATGKNAWSEAYSFDESAVAGVTEGEETEFSKDVMRVAVDALKTHLSW
ncbi:MAG: hypothetical protein AAF891_06590 [Pseudomonadota bacterium]